MDVARYEFELASEGHGHVYDLTEQVTTWLASITASEGQLTVFVPGSTAAITTIEFEPGAVRDLVEALERVELLSTFDGSEVDVIERVVGALMTFRDIAANVPLLPIHRANGESPFVVAGQ